MQLGNEVISLNQLRPSQDDETDKAHCNPQMESEMWPKIICLAYSGKETAARWEHGERFLSGGCAVLGWTLEEE